MRKIFTNLIEAYGRLCWIIADGFAAKKHMHLALYFIREARKSFEWAKSIKR